MMDLSEAVDLVLFAFEHGNTGDLFVQKSPSSTIMQVATALKRIYNSDVPINIIGTRHGEKKHEALLSREECLRSTDVGSYFKVHLDDRDLNYGLYFSEGQENLSNLQSYASDNTVKLSDEELEKKLLNLECVRAHL